MSAILKQAFRIQQKYRLTLLDQRQNDSASCFHWV